MGMYTEIYVNVDLIKETPASVTKLLRAMCDRDWDNSIFLGSPSRWQSLFNSASYYTPSTRCGNLTYDDISEQWSLIGKGDIKNYEGEIEQFFKFLAPYVEDDFMGYYRYEESRSPTLMYARDSEES